MNTDQLKRAKELDIKLRTLNEHLDKITREFTTNNGEKVKPHIQSITIYFPASNGGGNWYWNNEGFRPETFIPATYEQIFKFTYQMYVQAIKDEITKLQTEFDAL